MRKIYCNLYYIVLFFLLLQTRFVSAQDPFFRNYLQDEGLINSTVYHSLQDSDGFMWFATESGAVRFNGKAYQHFTIEDGLADNEILKIYEDSQHRIWFLTLSGRLSFYYKGTFYNSANSSLIKKTRVNSTLVSFFEDSNQNLWFAGLDNHYIRISKDRVVSRFNLNNVALGMESIFIENSQGQVMLVCKEGFFKIIGDKPVKQPFKFTLANSRARFYSKKTGLVFLAEEGIVHMQDTVQRLLLQSHALPKAGNLGYFYIDSKANLWLTTLGEGIFKIPNYKRPTLPVKHYLSNKIITSALEDSESNLWFTTLSEGAYMQPANNYNIQTITTADGLAENKIYTVTSDKAGHIWLGLNKGILQKITPAKIYTYNINLFNQKYNRVKDIFFDHFQNAWVATDVGLTHLKYKSQNQYITTPILKSNKYFYPAKNVLQNKEGLISVVHSSGIDEVYPVANKEGNFTLRQLSYSPQIRTFTHFYDNTGSLWLSNVHGLIRIEKGQFLNFGNKYPLLKNRVSAITQAPDSTIIVSTFGYGILFIKNHKIVNQLRKTQGLPDNTVNKLTIYGKEVWASTYKGVIRFTYSQNKITDLVHYSTINGLLSNEVNDLELNKDHAYLATDKGLSIIKRSLKPPLPKPPKIQFTKVVTKNKELNFNQLINLSNRKNALSINFIAISFLAPRHVEYQYRLKELNKAWTLTSDTYVHYPFLESGSYTFEIRARKLNSNWSKPIYLHFHIEPPFYRTWWFITLTAILVLAFIIYLVRSLTNRKLKQKLQLLETENKIQQERQRIARDLHDNVGSQLAYIINYLDDSSPTKLEFQQKHLREFTKQTISELRDTIWAIRQKNITMAGLEAKTEMLLRQVLSLRSGVTYHMQGFGNPQEELSPAQALNLYRIIQESLNNIVKHSLATHIEILFEVTVLNELSITITDNGIGFNIDSVLPDDHYGLLNMQHRATEIPGQLTIHSEPGEGTIIIIKTPLVISNKSASVKEEVYM